MTEQSVALEIITVDRLRPHPKNPRAIMRQHVVDGIVDGIKRAGQFKPNHAITVRPVDDYYEVISGHHRLEAAKQAALKALPCWVEVLDDETAFYELIRNNNQGELSPLEIGLHALEFVEAYENGGIKRYAEKIGYKDSSVSEYRQAAKVYRYIVPNVRNIDCDKVPNVRNILLSKTQNLKHIHSADKNCWKTLVELMLSKEWTVQETAKKVKRANEFEIPIHWQLVFLPLSQIVYRSLDTDDFSPKTVNKLIEAVEAIESRISTYKTRVAEFLWEFRVWLTAHSGADSWDFRKIEQYGRELQARVEAAEREEQERFLLGDWRDCLDKLQDESVALVLTDPPYGMDYQSDYRLDRDKERKHETIEGDASTEDAIQGISACLTALHSKLKPDAHVFCFCHWSNEADIRRAVEAAGYTIRGSLIWVKNNTGMGDPTTTFAPKHERIIHAVKGSPVLFSRAADVLLADRCNSELHPTEKPVALLKQLIEVTTTKDELVVDPFAGVASTLVAAKELGRAFFGCEINEGYFIKGSERL